jgi:TP901 family phage tail tape measure protein
VPDNDYRLSLAADLSQMERGLAQITNQLAGVVGGLNETDAAIKKTENSTKTAAQSQTKFSTSLNSTRYALYDVSRTMLVAGAALLAFGLAPTKVAIDFQREFANVQRTVSGAGDDIKNELKDLSTQIPVTFKNLTEIATLGGQLGISKDGIVEFTETIAKLTATTNLSADVAGTALGRFQSFGLVTSGQFEKLASSILRVGVTSVATESQIVTIATRIAGIGKLAGLNAQTLVGFAGALASVGVQSYAASGSTIRLIQKMQEAVTNGGDKLATFARVAGVSTDTFKAAFGTEKFNPIFQSFIENLGNVQKAGGNVNKVLDDLGLKGAIDSRTFSQLAAASGTVSKSFEEAAKGFSSASTLNEQYGRVASTTASKIQELGNSIMNLLDSVGSATTGPLGDFVSLLIDATRGLTSFLSTSPGQTFALIATAVAVLSGAVLILGSIASRGAASLIGLVTAVKGLGAESATSTGFMAALNAELAASGPLGAKAAAGMKVSWRASSGRCNLGGDERPCNPVQQVDRTDSEHRVDDQGSRQGWRFLQEAYRWRCQL